MNVQVDVQVDITPVIFQNFNRWARNTYASYSEYIDACSQGSQHTRLTHESPDRYIFNNILTPYMRNVYNEVQEFHGQVLINNEHITQLRVVRRKIIYRIKYLMRHLGERTYPHECARHYFNITHASWNMFLEQRSKRNKRKIITTIHCTEKEANEETDCIICMSLHPKSEMCLLSCGHEFGNICFDQWRKHTCPLCRATCNEKTVYNVGYIK